MLLRHDNAHTESVCHDGETYEVGDKRLFDLPPHVAEWLQAHQPGWSVYDGTDESQADRAAELEAENAELRRQLAAHEAAKPANPGAQPVKAPEPTKAPPKPAAKA